MHRIFFIVFIGVVLLVASCKDATTNNTMKNKQYFDFDEIDYYIGNHRDDDVGELYNNKSKSTLDSIKVEVVLEDVPHNIRDLYFIKVLDKIGYKRSKVPASKFAAIGEIFSEKKAEMSVATACIYVYQDILIFKKKGRVIGVAKLCFGCMANHIVGTAANTEDFGQDGDYDRLWKILNR